MLPHLKTGVLWSDPVLRRMQDSCQPNDPSQARGLLIRKIPGEEQQSIWKS